MQPDLSDVTLVAVSSVALEATVAALESSLKRASFRQTVLLSDSPPPRQANAAIEWRQIPPIRSRTDYSRFMLRHLADHIETSHALCVQWDGFVLNGDAWDPQFLEFDYIGAVWPHFDDGKNVGNGGFSLRSKRLLDACGDLPFDGSCQEDIVISRLFRQHLQERGIRFAPEEVARRFSYERTKPTGREFGFHGAFNLVRYLSPAKAANLFRTLEPGVLTRREHMELLRWALRRRYGRLALAIVLRLAPAGSALH